MDAAKTILLTLEMLALYKGLLVSAVTGEIAAAIVKIISGSYYLIAGDPKKVAKKKTKRNADIFGAIMDLWDIWK